MSQVQTITADIADIVASNDEPKAVAMSIDMPTAKITRQGSFVLVQHDAKRIDITRSGAKVAAIVKDGSQWRIEVDYNGGKSGYVAWERTKQGAINDAIYMAGYYCYADICR